MLYNSIVETIGNTPLVRLQNIEKKFNLQSKLFAKVEFFNPGSSVKDRIAFNMIQDAENKGLLQEGSTIIEPTSGNTGIGLAMIGASKGYQVILVMPDTLSVERRKIMKAFGAKLVLTEGSKGMKGAIAEAERLKNEIPQSYMPYQFQNPANPEVHYQTTGPEIWKDLNGNIDVFVAGIGTGGTISGTSKYIKERKPDLYVVGIEPEGSKVITDGTPGPHKIQGIGAGFIPKTLNTEIYNEIFVVKDEEAFEYSRYLSLYEGMFSGISAGAALKAAISLAQRESLKGKNIVFVVPDTGERYLSTALFEEK